MSEDKIFENQSLLYQENAKVAAIFWESRHKVMTYFFTAIGALFALVGWLYQQHFGRLISAPFFLGFVISFVSLLLDWRHAGILHDCYRVGEGIELELRRDKGAIFKSIRASHKWVTYTWTLRAAYVLVGALFLALSILILIRPVRQ